MKDEERVRVLTPFPLTKEHKDIISTKLSRIITKPFVIEEEVDPSLIGGVVILWGELLIDCSVKTQLERIRERILGEEELSHGGHE
ncbi:MAG: F0F1 ATP synthase subunit delta [Candidatus Caldatribacterium sp.]|uniref:F0F1 ATP synthase subunit delta n=1 Tax=Candidatus Caldatribacterium sp. TaxID=2282143 RepID=UPI0029952A4C|nr:F0F1 ATP synthase subunit delta [Candidatus Caldatribacterium sp.]MCX7731266.1 F0F1 ATP synthase subunit delta [Candidatus Caldatribacterium sp.]MDW8081466.1 F0F1 ATP synthase subunit delta [Candidatus Calescibacterium sp.]